MIYLYRRMASQSAREVVNTLEGEMGMAARRVRRWPPARPIRNGDVLVSWGEAVPGQQAGLRVLNGAPIRNKYDDAIRLRDAGIATIEVSRTRPIQPPLPPPVDLVTPALARVQEVKAEFIRAINQDDTTLSERLWGGLNARWADLNRARHTIPPPQVRPPLAEWVGRMNAHIGGDDLLNPPARPDFYVKKENLVNEYRVHSFRGQSIRAGVKVHREEVPNPHGWVRSWDGGWRISYADGAVRQAQRDIAHRAVAALGLDFGAVDIGERADHTLMVLEVNRAPGAEGGTPMKYAEAISRYLRG